MNPHLPHQSERITQRFSVARIVSLNRALVSLLQEYLEIHGYIVILNREPTSPTYITIVCGDSTYVNKFFAGKEDKASDRFIMAYDMSEDEARLLIQHNTKVCFLPPGAYGAREVEPIFAFFFQGGNSFYRLKAKPKPKPQHPDQTKTLTKSKPAIAAIDNETDEERIAREMSSIFVEPIRKKSNIKRKIIGKLIKTIIKRIGQFFLGTQDSPSKKTRRRNLLIISIAMSPVLLYIVCVTFSFGTIGASARQMTNGNTVLAGRFARSAQVTAGAAREIVNIVTTSLELVGLDQLTRGQERLVEFLEESSLGELGALKVASEGKAFALTYLFPKDRPSGEINGEAALALDILTRDIENLDSQLGLIQAHLGVLLISKPFPLMFRPLSRILQAELERLAHLHKSLSGLRNLLTLYPQMSGFKEKKTYLVLLQNSTELRPTGGFIGSIAQVSLVDGKITEFTLQDVYAIDGQLRGHVDPPEELRDLLGLEHWYLRDSNWDPDFPKSGARAAWFYQKETGVQVDGVIALSTPFITSLLSNVGPVDLPDFNDHITASNFYAKSYYYTQVDFFPGSTQKKDFLGALSEQLLAKLSNTQAISTTKLFKGVTDALTSGDIMLFFTDPKLQTTVERYGWAGQVDNDITCRSEINGCLDDFISLVEANVGVNKVNYFLTRNIRQQVTIGEDGAIRHAVNIVYHNGSNSGVGSGGAYKAFLQLVVPADSRVDEVKFEGKPVVNKPLGRHTDRVLPYNIVRKRDDGLSIGIAFTVPEVSDRTVSISYSRNRFLTFEKTHAAYALFVRRQPGLMNTIFALSLRVPNLWTVLPMKPDPEIISVSPALVAKQQELEYNTNLTTSRFIPITFQK